ncbi:MAG: hypothetical protein ABI611_12980 [Solirubrobacteraceae bacterium]
MATDTALKQNDTKPAESTAASTPATPKRKPASRAKAKTASKSRSRTRSTASSSSRSRTASKPAKPAAETAAAPRTEAKALNGGRQFVAGVIDAQEKSVTAIVDYQTRAAELSQIPGATAIADAQAQVLRSVTDAYVTAARAFLK